MKSGTVIWTKETELGIYLYPLSKPVQDNTICSVLCKKDELIYHVPYTAIRSYKNQCWHCHTAVNSNIDKTCSICHWAKCPVCHSCRRPECSPDSFHILDKSDPSDWESVTGFDVDSFFDEYENDEYERLTEGNFEKIESYFEALVKYKLHPLLILNSLDIITIYVEADDLHKAKEIISCIDNDTDDDSILDSYFAQLSFCVFCGEPTTDGDMLCPMCANNVD